MDEDEVAAAMGFSSFGASKKRKYQHSSSPKPTVGASGANSTQLGVRAKISNSQDGSSEAKRDLGHAGGGNDTVLESTEPSQSLTTNTKGKPKHPPALSLGDFLARGHSLPDKPIADQQTVRPNDAGEDPSVAVSFGGEPITKAELNALRQGVQNEHGDMTYFLPSFLEDPWENLRQAGR